MSNTEIRGRIQAAARALDAREYPEIMEYIASATDLDEAPYDIANHLLRCDRPKPLPAAIRELIAELFQIAFEDGNADAMNDLGAQYYDGSRGFAQDFGKAVRYYELAAQNGSRQAQENLGYCYYYGRNMPVDYEKAFHYFALGAFDGHLISLYKIADMYANGYYVPKNEKEAFHIYAHCAETMTEAAAKIVAGPVYLRLGNCYLHGIGTHPDAKTALICYQRAELFLFDMVQNGDIMYKKSLRAAIEGQAKARAILSETLPRNDWTFD